MNIKIDTTRDDMIQEIEALKDELTTLQFDHTSLKAERDDWQETANMARAARDGFELAHKDALKRIRLMAHNRDSLFTETKVLIEDLRKARAHRDRLLDERNELSDRLFRPGRRSGGA